MKRVEVYVRRGQLILHPSSQTTDGVWIATGPFIALEATGSKSEKAAAIRECLATSKTAVPHPKSWAGILEPLLKAAGVKSWEKLMIDAKGVGIEENNEMITFTPLRNSGAADGFVEILDKSTKLSAAATDEDLCGALDTAINRSE